MKINLEFININIQVSSLNCKNVVARVNFKKHRKEYKN